MPDLPDFFDRLLARHATASLEASTAGAHGRADGAGGPVRVRPRLPGPFERIEALRAEPPLPGGPAPLVASSAAPRPAAPERAAVVREREIRTDRHTVDRAVPPADAVADWPATGPRAPASPLLQPAARAGPPRPAAVDGTRAERRRAAAQAPAEGAAEAGAATATPGIAGVVSSATAPPVRPRSTDAAMARGAARSSAGRRGSRPSEQVVHVQIGRLEVSAAGAADGNRAAASRPVPPGRQAPVMSLNDYLSRGGKRD